MLKYLYIPSVFPVCSVWTLCHQMYQRRLSPSPVMSSTNHDSPDKHLGTAGDLSLQPQISPSCPSIGHKVWCIYF